jgi:hypothetical protein
LHDKSQESFFSAQNNKNVRNLWNLSAYYCFPNDYFMHGVLIAIE